MLLGKDFLLVVDLTCRSDGRGDAAGEEQYGGE